MRDFFSTSKFKLLMFAVALISGMMAWAGANGRLLNAPQELLGAILVPFQSISAHISGGTAGIWQRYANIEQIMDENEALKLENSALRQRMIDYDAIKAENEAFHDLARLQEETPDYRYASGFIIGRDPLEQFGGFTIDVGRINGVKTGDVVVSDQGYLVGLVLETGINSSKIITILSPNLNASGVISSTRDNGIVTGSAEYAAQGLCLFTNLSRTTEAGEGDVVITSGLGGVFPKNLLVGNVTEVLPESSGTSMTAVLQPGQDLSDLQHVFVIIGSNGEE